MSSILVLDDRPADRELLATLLEHAGHSVTQAATGNEALGMVHTERPDLVITDILMPEMNGYEFVRQLHSDRRSETVPVIFCTASYSADEVRRLASAVGVSRFISKPSDFEDIVTTVDAALGAPTAPPPPLTGEEFDREHLRLLNGKLVEKVNQLEEADSERRKLLWQLVNAHEEERRRIAGELHDDSVQAVIAMGMRLEILEARTSDDQLKQDLARLRDDAASTVEALRRLLFELEPMELDRSGLRVALEIVLEQSHADQGLEYELVDHTTRQPTEAVRTLLYRAGREALTNIRKHAGAEHVEVCLDQDSQGFSLQVKDDGRGLDIDQAMQVRVGHLGLTAMRERFEMAGGRLTLESERGTGTTVDGWLPDSEANDD